MITVSKGELRILISSKAQTFQWGETIYQEMGLV